MSLMVSHDSLALLPNGTFVIQTPLQQDNLFWLNLHLCTSDTQCLPVIEKQCVA